MVAKFVVKISSKKQMDSVHSLVGMVTRAGKDSNPGICEIHGINCGELNVECIDVSGSLRQQGSWSGRKQESSSCKGSCRLGKLLLTSAVAAAAQLAPGCNCWNWAGLIWHNFKVYRLS